MHQTPQTVKYIKRLKQSALGAISKFPQFFEEQHTIWSKNKETLSV